MNRGMCDCQMDVQVIRKVGRGMDRCVDGQMCEWPTCERIYGWTVEGTDGQTNRWMDVSG